MKKYSRSVLLAMLCALGLCARALAQDAYTTSAFTYDSVMNVSYGTATDYAGNAVDLLLDIYKPIGDGNCLRPVLVLVHGGAWVGGSKEDPYMVIMSRAFAQRGWVVANINYRLGTHKTSNYSMYALCNTSISQPCGYICDSAEVLRANFRGMQDVKGVVRFMKGRHVSDSTDINNVFIAGESAGAFIALASAFTDREEEKVKECFAIDSAPTPDADLAKYGCIPKNNDLRRPDLGSIEGSLHVGFHNARVAGVGAFYGAVFNLNILQQTEKMPCVYLFHQGSDVVVHYQNGQVLGRTSWECYAQTNICQSYYFYPYAIGTQNIEKHFAIMGSSAPVYVSEIINNYSYLNNCFSNGHSIDNVTQRSQNMINLFANKIALSGNDPKTNCLGTAIESESGEQVDCQVMPNPSTQSLHLRIAPRHIGSEYSIYDEVGLRVLTGVVHAESESVDISHLPQGVFVLRIGNTIHQMFAHVRQ